MRAEPQRGPVVPGQWSSSLKQKEHRIFINPRITLWQKWGGHFHVPSPPRGDALISTSWQSARTGQRINVQASCYIFQRCILNTRQRWERQFNKRRGRSGSVILGGRPGLPFCGAVGGPRPGGSALPVDGISMSAEYNVGLQCFDTVGWPTGKASCLLKPSVGVRVAVI